MSIKGFEIDGQVKKYDYESLDNLPFYEKLITTTFDPANIIEGEDVSIIPSTALNLTVGDTAQYELLLDGNSVATGSAEVLDGEDMGFPGHGFLYIAETINEDDAIVMVVDKLSASLEPSETESIAVPPLPNLTIKISSGAVKKIDKKFLPDDIATKLEVATSEVLGGVMPVEKQSSMTQEVGIDEEGRLFTKAVLGAESYNPSLHTVPCAIDGENKIWAKVPEITTTSSIQQGSTEIPTSDAVYSFIEELLAEGEY